MKTTVRLGVARLLVCGSMLLVAGGCGLLGSSPSSAPASPEPSPTLLPPPRAFSSPEPVAKSPASPPASPTSSVPPTPIPPPDLNAKPQASTAASGPRVRVVNTEGQGANMRAEPVPNGALVTTIREGAELEAIGDERESGGRPWRNVRDPATGQSGWIVSELLAPVSPAPVAAPAPAASPSPESRPAGEPKPDGAPKPPGEPKPAASPPPASAPTGPSQPSQRIGEADRAYLGVLQTQIDVLGTSITTVNEQIERVGGRTEMLSDPAWRQETEATARALQDAATKIRAAQPGPATGEVHRFATNAADRADEAADGLLAALNSRDPRSLGPVRTTLVRMLAEINNMNLTLLELQ